MEFPIHPEALTAAWLTDRLRESGAIDKAAVQSFRCAPVDPHNGMTGVLMRLRLSYDFAEPAAPATLVAKFSLPEQSAELPHRYGERLSGLLRISLVDGGQFQAFEAGDGLTDRDHGRA